MILPLIFAAAVAAKPVPARPPVSKEERQKQLVFSVLKRVPNVAWQDHSLVWGDLNSDGRPDAAVLGLNGDEVVIATLWAPVTGATTPVLLRFHKPKGDQPLPGDICGDPKDLSIGLEPPGVKPSDLACAGIAFTPECKRTLQTEKRLQKVRAKGGRGIQLGGGKCPPLHIYFDLGRAFWWRGT